VNTPRPTLRPRFSASARAKASWSHRSLPGRRWPAWLNQSSVRSEDCWLKNFDQSHDHQAAAVSQLADYCREAARRVGAGEGLLLFGPKGTGKDHLIVAVARAAIRVGKSVRWQNGMDLFGDIRDAIDKGDAEREIVRRLVAPDVLYLSDPLPPVGNLTEFQGSMLFRILDGRYSRRKPTWCSVNVASGNELDGRMGAQNGDRLRDGALAIFCDWPSYRKVKA
jgi:DNA replication protein DnaC